MLEACFQRVFEFLGGLRFVAFGLRSQLPDRGAGPLLICSDCCNERLPVPFMMAERPLRSCAMELSSEYSKRSLCQLGQCFLARFSDRVQPGRGFLGLLQLFYLCHADGTRPAFAAQWFGKQLSCIEQSLRLFCFGAVRA